MMTTSENSCIAADATVSKWTFQDIQHLLKMVKAALPENDIFNYSTALSLLNWNELNFGLFTADECKSKLLEILQMIRRHRTLSELITDATKFFKSPENSETGIVCKNTSITNAPITDFENIETDLQSQTIDSNNPTHSMEDEDIQFIRKVTQNIDLSTSLKKTNWCRAIVNREKVKTIVVEKSSLKIANTNKSCETRIKKPVNKQLNKKNSSISTRRLDLKTRKKSVQNTKNKQNKNKNLKGNQHNLIKFMKALDKRSQWGYMLYANQNLHKLSHTKPEEKLNAIYKVWKSLDDSERESYIERAIRNSYVNRDRIQSNVFKQVKMT